MAARDPLRLGRHQQLLLLRPYRRPMLRVLGGWVLSHERGAPVLQLTRPEGRAVLRIDYCAAWQLVILYASAATSNFSSVSNLGIDAVPALHPKPYTPNPSPHTLHPTPYTPPYTPHPTPQTLHPRSYTLHPEPSTLNPQPSTTPLNPQPSTPNPQPSTLTPHPSPLTPHP